MNSAQVLIVFQSYSDTC